MARILAIITAGVVDNVLRGDAIDFPGAIDVTDVDPRPAPGWQHVAGDFAPPVEELVAPVRRITRLAFRNRFALAELIALEIAGVDNPSASADDRRSAASIRVMTRSVDTATFIDLDHQDVRGSVFMLEAGGLLADGRASEILDTPVQSHELLTIG